MNFANRLESIHKRLGTFESTLLVQESNNKVVSDAEMNDVITKNDTTIAISKSESRNVNTLDTIYICEEERKSRLHKLKDDIYLNLGKEFLNSVMINQQEDEKLIILQKKWKL